MQYVTGSSSLRTIHIGTIIADKGFPPSKITDEHDKHPDFHFLTPVKRNDSRIVNNNMLSSAGKLENVANRVLFKKSCIKGERYLYAF